MPAPSFPHRSDDPSLARSTPSHPDRLPFAARERPCPAQVTAHPSPTLAASLQHSPSRPDYPAQATTTHHSPTTRPRSPVPFRLGQSGWPSRPSFRTQPYRQPSPSRLQASLLRPARLTCPPRVISPQPSRQPRPGPTTHASPARPKRLSSPSRALPYPLRPPTTLRSPKASLPHPTHSDKPPPFPVAPAPHLPHPARLALPSPPDPNDRPTRPGETRLPAHPTSHANPRCPTRPGRLSSKSV